MSAIPIDLGSQVFARLRQDRTVGRHVHDAGLVAIRMNGRIDPDPASIGPHQESAVSWLPARGGVEDSAVENDPAQFVDDADARRGRLQIGIVAEQEVGHGATQRTGESRRAAWVAR